MSVLVSIVVPVYNTEKCFLIECFESIRLQTYRDIEVVVVDDGSGAETAKFIDEYTAGLVNWRVVHKQNGGLNMARRTGYEHSSGEYISFVDSDDTVRNDFVAKLYQACSKHGTEFSSGEMSEFSTGSAPAIWGNPFHDLKSVEWETRELVNNQLILNGYNSKLRIFEGAVWGKLYTRTLIDRIDWNFSDYRITEDEFFTIQVNIYAKGAAFVHEQLYFYRVSQPDSLGQKVKPNAHGQDKFPYLHITREVYEKFKKLLTDNRVPYNHDDLVRLYVHALLDRARRIAKAGGLDKENRLELARQAKQMLPLIEHNKVMSKEWLFLARLVFADIEQFVWVDSYLNESDQRIHRLEEHLAEVRDEEQTQGGIKDSLKQLKNAVRRSLRR